ncbi:zona pellucida protein AX 1 [Syngnathoides biaculeatus]|uniref:zona pellucida protein AX 1 n=1 Tax=Syngnathoides biaculeatus TaxID=300417 RepID=UPI002ADD468D|nr:zona pellucida protein AX 1 [Syngnathoides biaculeatus]
MMWLYSNCKMSTSVHLLIWSLLAVMIGLSQAKPNTKSHTEPSGLKADCVGNLMRLSLDKALAVGNQLEVQAINGTRHIVLTPALAAQCGYSMESDPWGNTRIYTSLMGCYVDNKKDASFDIALKLRMYSRPADVVSHNVMKTCSYTRWATREILCDRNYMEVSNYMPAPVPDTKDEYMNAVPNESGAEQGIWKLTFYTPKAVVMMKDEAEEAGYKAMTTATRLVMRSPYDTAETYSEDVAGVPMELFKVSVYHKKPEGLTVMNMVAACPTGGVLFTDDMISWHVPRRVTPLLDGSVKILEMQMGINGQRLDRRQMAARGYTLSATDFHLIIEIPVGSPDGYNKSHAPDYQYHITYTVEPMLEVLWRCERSHEDTRYKILFPITTPLMPRPPQAVDFTNAEERLFSIHVGTFVEDVELKNITFSTGTYTSEECGIKGFVVQEHRHPGGTKSFSLKVPFAATEVLKHNPEPLVTTYTLALVFGFLIYPEASPFAHPVELVASLQDVVLPTLQGTCDHHQFYVEVTLGNQGKNFQTLVGYQPLTPEVAQAFRLHENETHLTLVVPFTAKETTFELITSDSVRARLDMLLWEPNNNWMLADLYLTCNFPLQTTVCYPNGTMTALAVKVESVPNLIPSWLTLKDKSCKPTYSDDRFAYFAFAVATCGTTRTFFENYMLYQNEIGLYYKGNSYTSPNDPEYRQTVSCYYMVNDTQTVTFGYKSRSTYPSAEIGQGQLDVQIRLAHDSSYYHFYQPEDYPVMKYLREPLYFEVELTHSNDPSLELILESCWATANEDGNSLPSWDVIVNTCENKDDSYVTLFHPVTADSRVQIPSHFKRFSLKMFTFTKDDKVLKDEIYIHCNAMICDTNGDSQGICRGQCPRRSSGISGFHGIKGVKRTKRSPDSTQQRKISSGPISLFNSE